MVTGTRNSGGSRLPSIEKATENLLRKHGIVEPPIPVKEIAEKEGIILRFHPFKGRSDISAVLKRDGETAIVGVNSAHSATRQRFSIAHELGHYFLHTDENLFVDFGERLQGLPKLHFRNSISSQATDSEEIEANNFAANLLMPKLMVGNHLLQIMENDPDFTASEAVSQLANIFHVSSTAMEYRLLNLGYLVKLDE